jgi:hypothetical protein
MIANVTMGFNFVGGSGLKESIDKLQNALTFNYYANTEIWDDRADVTSSEEFLKSLDKEFLAMAPPPSPPTLNQAEVENGQNNNSAIGTVTTNEVTATEEKGTLNYSDFMVKVVKETQTYFQTIVNKTKESVNQYNNAVRQQWMLERSYTQGSIRVSENPTVLFGKPSNVEKRFDEIFASLQKNISDGDEGFIQWMSSPSFGFSTKVIRQLKDNYINLVKNIILGSKTNTTKLDSRDFMYEIVANGKNSIDVDKMDYLSRDMYYLFGSEKSYDFNRIFKYNRIIDNTICYNSKISFDIYNLFIFLNLFVSFELK